MQTPAQSQYALFHSKIEIAGLNSAKSWTPIKSTMAAPPGSSSLPFTGASLEIVLIVAVLLVAASVLLRVRALRR